VYPWLRELVAVPDGIDALAATLGLRGFEVASVEHSPHEVIDFEITANRPDCLSTIGLAREASAAYDLALQLPARATLDAAGTAPIEVAIDDPDLCGRYCAQAFEIRPAGTPAWLRQRLEAAGVRSISAVVDVTNYVMLEMGQPTHAFDLDRLDGPMLRARRAGNGEAIRTLDGVARTLDRETLVIADATRPQAIAGVMGGGDSEIGSTTRRMVLESAYFTPASVRRTSRRLGLKTEASTRFERGADVEAAPAAIARIAVLLRELGAGEPIGPMIDVYPARKPPVVLTLRAERIARVLGIAVPDGQVPRILEPLGFGVTVRGTEVSRGEPPTSNLQPPHAWSVIVPTFRVDVLREIDLVEEIARHDGYAGLPATFPALKGPQLPPDARTIRDRTVRHVLTACGLSEAMTFAFVEADAAAPFAVDGSSIPIANPLSEKYAVLRPSLLPGLVDSAAYNRRRERKDVRLFETGTRFSALGEARCVAGVWCGAGAAPHWSGGARPVDFFDVKGAIEALCDALGVTPTFEPAAPSWYVEGRAAHILVRPSGSDEASEPGTPVGSAGQIRPALLDARGFPPSEELYAFELDLEAIAARQPGRDLRAESLPRHPSVVRDMSILVDSILPAAGVRGTIRSAAPATLAQLIEFDRYRGKGVPEGRVSLSLRLTFRSPDRTLTDIEVDEAMARIVSALESKHGAERR
jgi:phenylalanyl-tRNA synthetase beta chain